MADVQTIINTPRETTHQRIADALEDIVDKIVDTSSASNIDYDSTISGLSANKVQGAIDELALAGFITNTVNNLVNYYLKSEIYNKTEVDSLINTVKNSRFEVVPTLPTTDIKTNVIYLVPKSPTQTSNAKDEYINLDGTSSGWEKIGDTEVDLSGYVTTTALNTALSNYTTTANLTNLLDNKVDKVTGKGLSTNDYTDEEKNKLSGIEAGANKTVVDSVMSSTSTNPLQNKVITTELETSKSISGSIITLSDASATNLQECKVSIEAVQEGSGDPSPDNIRPISGWSAVDVTRCGKNLFDVDGQLSAYAINSGGTRRAGYRQIFKAGTYTASAQQGNANTYIDLIKADFSVIGRLVSTNTVTNITFTLNEDTEILIFEAGSAQTSIAKTRFEACQVQIEIGSTATTYEPYKGKTYTIQIGDTIYGGELDVLTGELRVTHGEVDLGSLTWIKSSEGNNKFLGTLTSAYPNDPNLVMMSSCYVFDGYGNSERRYYPENGKFRYAFPATAYEIYITDERYSDATAFKEAVTGQTLVYELAAPYTIQLTPQQIRLLKGTNNISCNTGDLSIKYQPDNVIGDTIEYIEKECESLSDDISINSGTYNLLKVRKSYLDETIQYLKSLGYTSSYYIPTGGDSLYEDSTVEGAIKINGSSDSYDFFEMVINFYCHKTGDYVVRGSRDGKLVVNLMQGSTTVATIGGTPDYHERGYGVQKIVSLEKGKLYRYRALIPTAESISDELYPMITSVENADKPYQLVIDNEYEVYQQANISDFNSLSSDIDVSLSNSALPNYIAVAQNKKWLTVNNNHVPYVDGDYIVTFVMGTYRENIAFRVYGDGTGVDELSHFGSGRVFSGVRVVYGHNGGHGDTRVYADSIELICDTSQTFTGSGKLSIQVIPNEKMITNYSVNGYYQGQEIECCKASEKLAYTISVTSTYSSNMFYDKNSRTRRDITNDLSNLSQAVAEQNLEKYGYKIGDYFTGASRYTYILADYNTFKGTSTPYCISTNHIGIVVDTHATSQWHSGDASSVGYNGSTLHTYLKGTVMDNIKSDFIALFGGSTGLEHLLSHSKLLTTALANWGWQANQYISALTCTQIDAGSQWTANGFQEGEASKSLELFRKYKWTEIFGGEYPWLRDLSNYGTGGSYACGAGGVGYLDGVSVADSNFVVGLINFY